MTSAPLRVTLNGVGNSNHERRQTERVDVDWEVDCSSQETFLYAAITNLSAVGIFVRTDHPLDPGTTVRLRFSPPEQADVFELSGVVEWVNPVRAFGDNRNPGMGVSFVGITPAMRERLVSLVRTIAYVRKDAAN